MLERTELTMKEIDSVMKKLNITHIKSKCLCPSLLIENNLFVNAKTYPFKSFGTTPWNLSFTLFDWEAVKFC